MHCTLWVKLFLIYCDCRASHWIANSCWHCTSLMFIPPSPTVCLFHHSGSALSRGSFWNKSSLWIPLSLSHHPSLPLSSHHSLSILSDGAFVLWTDATWALFYSSAPFVLFIWQPSHRIVPGYQRSPADRVTACVRLWPISGFTFKSDSYHYLRDK